MITLDVSAGDLTLKFVEYAESESACKDIKAALYDRAAMFFHSLLERDIIVDSDEYENELFLLRNIDTMSSKFFCRCFLLLNSDLCHMKLDVTTIS